MGVLTPFVLSYMAAMFVCSGLVIVALQAVSCVLLWYPARGLYRRINAFLVNLYWTELVFFGEWWAGIRIKVFADDAVQESLGKEKAIALLNHKSDLDWLLGWFLASNWDVLGGTKCLLKSALRKLPILGWSWWYLEYTFLSRNWESDQKRLRKSLGALEGFPMPFWVVIFAEGTRLTDEKLKASQEHCEAKGLPVFKNVLYPRVKGFALAVDALHDLVDCFYDVTLAFPNQQPTLSGLINGVPCDVHMYIRRTPKSEVPKDADGSSEWLVDCYSKMDERLEDFNAKSTFDTKKEIPYKKQIFPFVVTTAWMIAFAAFLGWLVVPPLLAGSYWPAVVLAIVLSSGHLLMFAGSILAKNSDQGKRKAKSS